MAPGIQPFGRADQTSHKEHERYAGRQASIFSGHPQAQEKHGDLKGNQGENKRFGPSNGTTKGMKVLHGCLGTHLLVGSREREQEIKDRMI
jgi:hypothetical protein